MTYVIGDLNGNYDAWKKIIVKINLKSADMVFLTGNILGGADDIKLIYDLMARPNVYCVMGEREFLFSDCMSSLSPDADATNFMSELDDSAIENLTMFIKDGGRDTLMAFLALDGEERENILEYFEEMTLYDELDVNGKSYVITHSGLSNFSEDKDLDDYDLYDYITARHEPHEKLFSDRVLIFGHTPTYEFGDKYKGRAIITDSMMNINCGCGDDEGALCAVRLDDMREYYV